MNNSVSNKGSYLFGGFRLNASERTLDRGSERIRLTPRTFDLLLTLVLADGHLLSKEELMTAVWADAAVEEGNLNRTISSLRKALGEAKGENRFIETVPKSGYRFVASVTRPSSNSIDNNAGPTEGRSGQSLSWLWAAAAFVFMLGGLIAAFVMVPKQTATTLAKPEPTIAMQRLTDERFDDDQAEWTMDGKIRFTRYVTSTRAESWIMNSDGSDQRRANDRIPSLRSGQWSPDGKRVVFVKDGEPGKNVYLANSDGSGERRLNLTHPPSDWSPDGTLFVYAELVGKTNYEVFVYDIADGVSVNVSKNAAFDADPLFSPDGKLISFISSRDGNNEAYLMNLDGSSVKRLTNDPGIDAFPSVSPDGTQVIFDSNRDGENVDLYVKDINNDLPPRKLTSLPSNEEHRGNCWSLDGSKLLITSDQSGKSNIFVMSAESSDIKPFLSDPKADLLTPIFAPGDSEMVFQARYADRSLHIERLSLADRSRKMVFETEADTVSSSLSPSISPDGRTIVFANRVAGNSDLFVVPSHGGEAVNISNSPSAEGEPSFSRDGSRIYFQSNRDLQYGRFQLLVMNKDGSDVRRVTGRDGYEFSPVEAKDGWLLFSCDREDGASKSLDICSFYTDKSASDERIASRRYHDTQPAYSKELDVIAFVSQSEGNNEIFVVRPDGKGMVRLTNDPGDDISPQFFENALYFSSDRSGRFAIYSIDLSSFLPERNR